MLKLLDKWKIVCATIATLITLGWASNAYLNRYAEASKVEEVSEKVVSVEKQLEKIIVDIGWIRNILEKGQCR